MNWISVKDEVPKKDEDVLVWWHCHKYGTEHGHHSTNTCSVMALGSYDKKWSNGEWWIHGYGDCCTVYDNIEREVTHWAPLPECPKGFKKEKK